MIWGSVRWLRCKDQGGSRLWLTNLLDLRSTRDVRVAMLAALFLGLFLLLSPLRLSSSTLDLRSLLRLLLLLMLPGRAWLVVLLLLLVAGNGAFVFNSREFVC